MLEYITDKYPIELNENFIDDDIENPNTYWRHKITGVRYKVLVTEKWSWNKFKYYYYISLYKM